MSAEASLSQENIESILHGITIPSPPQIIADLQMEMAMPDPDLNEMADMISKDPGLAGGVLKILGSPYYGSRDISSIAKAVMMLGMTTVTNIVNTLYLRDSLSANGEVSDETAKVLSHFWDSATDVARACSLVSRRLNVEDPDMAYMLGLFHNAGIPLLMQRFSNYPEILVQSYLLEGTRIVDVENEQCATNHAVLSFYAAKSWKLPKVLCQVISKHHNAGDIFSEKELVSDEEKAYLGVLKIAEHLAGLSVTLGNNENDEEWQQVGGSVLDYFGLSEFDYHDLVSYASDNGIGGQSYFM